MAKRVTIVAVAVLLVAVVWLTIHHFRRQRRYDGKTAAEWFPEFCAAEVRYRKPVYYSFSSSGTNVTAFSTDDARWLQDPAADGLRHLGTNAALFLASEIVRKDPAWAQAYWKARRKFPKTAKMLVLNPPVPRIVVRHQAVVALRVVGTNGVTAIPILIEGLQGADQFSQQAIIQGLAELHCNPYDYDAALDTLVRRGQFLTAVETIERLGLRTKTAAEVLGHALATGATNVTTRSVRQLSYLGPQAAPAVPALISALTNGDSELRYSATSALADIGPAASAAIPALNRLTNDSSEMVQHAAARALAAIGAEKKTNAPNH